MPKSALPSIIDFVTSPYWLNLPISVAQRTLLKTIYGLPLTKPEQIIYRECTGRTAYVRRPYRESTILCGARGGKDSRIAVPIALYETLFGGHTSGPGEQPPTIAIIAQDHVSARDVALRYAKEYCRTCPALADMLDGPPLVDRIKFKNGVQLLAFSNTEASVQGYRVRVGILDEVAFFAQQGKVNSDVEIQASLRRGMIGQKAQTKLIKISTPRGKSGVLYADSAELWASDDEDRMFWKAPSRLMNPTISEKELEAERKKDPIRYLRYYEAEFGDDEDSFLQQAWIARAVVPGRVDPQPYNQAWPYAAGCDFSGGGSDSTTIVIAHKENWEQGAEKIVMDALAIWTPRRGQIWDIERIAQEMYLLLRRYGLGTIYGDAYAGNIISSAFKKIGISYKAPEAQTFRPATSGWDVGKWEHRSLNRSDIYLKALPWLSQGMIEIHDHPRLIRELSILQRNPNDKIDHPPGEHDDLVNSLAISIAMLATVKVKAMAGGVPGTSLAERLGYIPIVDGKRKGLEVVGSPRSNGGMSKPWCGTVGAGHRR